MPTEQEARMGSGRLARYRFYLRQRPTLLVVLSLLAIIFFLAVTGLSQAYHRQRESLGKRWFTRGVADLNARRYDAAVNEFRTALLYSRDNYSYQLNLAEALMGLKHTGEASAYLLSLWDREPDNGVVNLELARIANQQGHTEDAIRHYHDAVYAVWPPDQADKRREARLELIDLYLRNRDDADAQAELIALAANAGDEPEEQQAIGNLFLRSGGYEHALTAFRNVLKTNRHNSAAMAGAGYAAFELGRYSLAEHYLQAAVAANTNDTQSAQLLKTTEMVLHMDPFRPGISAADRDTIVVDAFATAGQRLSTCQLPTQGNSGPVGPPLSLQDEWNSEKPKISVPRLRRDPDLVDSTMDLVFRIERQTSIVCGTPTGPDLALSLVAKLHEGS